MRAPLKVRSLIMAVVLANLVACGAGTTTESKRSPAEEPVVHFVPMNADSRPKPIRKEEAAGSKPALDDDKLIVPATLDGDVVPADQSGSYFYDTGKYVQEIVYTVKGDHLQLDLFQNDKLYRQTSVIMPTAQDFADSGVERLPYILYAKEMTMVHRPAKAEFANEVKLAFEKPTPIFINNAALAELPDDSFEFDMETEAAVSGVGYKISGAPIHVIQTTEWKRQVTVSYDAETRQLDVKLREVKDLPFSWIVYGYFITNPWSYRIEDGVVAEMSEGGRDFDQALKLCSYESGKNLVERDCGKQ